VTIPAAFARIATAFSAAGLGPYQPSVASWPGVPVEDDGGSIIEPGDPVEIDVMAQVDSVTDAMRTEAGFVDRDVRLLVLADGLSRPIDTDATVSVSAGASAGVYSVQTAQLDPMGAYFDCRGRRA
jgi:hypothetical protein